MFLKIYQFTGFSSFDRNDFFLSLVSTRAFDIPLSSKEQTFRGYSYIHGINCPKYLRNKTVPTRRFCNIIRESKRKNTHVLFSSTRFKMPIRFFRFYRNRQDGGKFGAIYRLRSLSFRLPSRIRHTAVPSGATINE